MTNFVYSPLTLIQVRLKAGGIFMTKIIQTILCVLVILGNLNNAASQFSEDQDLVSDEIVEGRLLFKTRVYGLLSSSKHQHLPPATAITSKPNSRLIGNGFGLDTALAVFFNDHFATELSLGLSIIPINNQAIQNIAYNYQKTVSTGSRSRIYMLPITITAQYHLTLLSRFRPYIGAGYHGAYLFTKSKQIKVTAVHGPVLQTGIDFVAQDNTLITLDVRQYFSSTKVTYKYLDRLSSKIRLNLLIISAGFGLKF